jgi:membrane-bound serine protease (ClpP class)
MKHILLYITLLLFGALNIKAQKVLSIKINGSINPASAEFIHKSIDKAVEQKAECLLIHLNTPGGLLASTRIIVSDILDSKVPVVVYVSPGGSHAGSAGVFVTMAANIAAMAPGTNIGAAHPVSSGGAMDTIMSEKVTNDAAAFIRTIAEKRNRNLEWAEESVRKSVAITEIEALRKKVIDLIAMDEQDLLNKIDGREIAVTGGKKILETKNARVERIEMEWVEKFLNMLSDPNIAYVLMMLGFYGLLFELYSPGAIFPGVIGGICLILAFYAMQTLPVNYAGVALIIFGIILFLLEIKITSHGMLAIGGVISLLIGSFMLFRTNSIMAFMRISWSVIITTTGITALFFLFVVAMALRAQRAKAVTGTEGLVGEVGETLGRLDPSGTIRVHGEVWNAESVSGSVEEGKKVRVTGIQNLKLFVEHI